MSNVLLGTGIGDALGVPFETMLFNNPFLLKWDQKTFLGSEHHGLKPGQWSDDTQMSLMVAESLINNHGFNPEDLANRYVEWISSGRARGYGRTTLMAIQNLQSGMHFTKSGIAGSLGNGTAMRAAPFGIYFRDNIEELINSCKIDSAITHASSDAEAGSIAIALATAYIVNNNTDDLINKICKFLPESKIKNIIYSISALLDIKVAPSQILKILGTKANVCETVPSALYCFLKFDNYQDAVISAIMAGGDTDTTAAIVGALFGAKNNNMPSAWISSVENKDLLIQLDSQLYNRNNRDFFPNVQQL